MKVSLFFIIAIIGILAIGFVGQELDLFTFSYFAPRYEAVHRKIFEQTPSYVQGKVQDLSNYKLQYEISRDDADKQAIQAVVRSQFANMDDKYIPESLRPYLHQMRGY